jgi:tRNA uridine 5-carboxymethylaminomethyl modification enzyme
MVYSTDATANAVRNNLHQSPMYSGVIKGIGTRYCPSFEDKIMRFPDHPRHLLYLEPEGVETGEYYINGLSTSLPVDVQREMVHSIPGLENAEISRYAYAIEYDFLPPEQLERSLKNKYYQNLFTAGQINGTSGYEEAAGQGLVAGMNAARVAGNQDVLELGRDSSYIGVMLDDISTKTIVEPYRLFTSRAEYRLTLRQDNADLRLANFAYKAGLLPTNVYNEYARYESLVTSMINSCREKKASGKTLLTLLKTISLDATPEELPFKKEYLPEVENYNNDFQVKRAWRELLVEAHYDGYLQREATQIKRLAHLEELTIPEDFDYGQVPGLCMESRQKLQKIRPTTLGQAGRIDGVTPADIALLQVVLKKNSN